MRDTAAIADSGPLICLARINQLELLPGLFAKILVPPEVWDEVTVRGKDHPGAHEMSQVTWLTIQAPDPQLVKPLSILVDAGEAQAIAGRAICGADAIDMPPFVCLSQLCWVSFLNPTYTITSGRFKHPLFAHFKPHANSNRYPCRCPNRRLG